MQAASAKIVLVLDMSPSVASQTSGMRTAIQTFLSKIGDRSDNVRVQVSVRGFDGRKELIDMLDAKGRAGVLGGTVLNTENGFFMLSKSNLKQIMDHIGTVRMGPEIPDNDFSTNLNGAVVSALSLLDKSSALVNVMVLFTDGKDQAGILSEQDAINKATSSKSDGVLICGVFLKSAEQTNEFIDNIATPAYSLAIEKLDEVIFEFDRLATFIALVCNNIFVYMYCSPKRSGSPKVQMYFDNTSATKEYNVDTSVFDVSKEVCTKVLFLHGTLCLAVWNTLCGCMEQLGCMGHSVT
jgi:hypothetical protein